MSTSTLAYPGRRTGFSLPAIVLLAYGSRGPVPNVVIAHAAGKVALVPGSLGSGLELFPQRDKELLKSVLGWKER